MDWIRRFFGGKAKFHAHAEWWIYLPSLPPPEQNQAMAAMMQYRLPTSGKLAPLTPGDGLIFSDVRLHIGLVLREKNPHVFRPDLLLKTVECSAAQLQALGLSSAVLVVRYVSDVPFNDPTFLRSLSYLVATYAKLSGAALIVDHEAEILWTTDTFQQALEEDPNATSRDLHVHTDWTPGDGGGTAQTIGMRKLGLPELMTPFSPSDHRAAIMEVLSLASEHIWNVQSWVPQIDLTAFVDQYRVALTPPKNGQTLCRIMRMNPT